MKLILFNSKARGRLKFVRSGETERMDEVNAFADEF